MILDPRLTYASYVNLDHRADRRERMQRTLMGAGLDFAVRQPGDVKYAGDESRLARMRARTPGTVGCSMSQYQVMKEALWRGKNALVMEDDLVFCSDFRERVPVIEAFLAENPWDVFWFGATFHVNPPVWHKDDLGRDVELTGHPRIVRTYGIWSTYCYLVNAGSVGKVLRLHDQRLHESVGIDTTFIELEPRLLTYAFVPGCVKQYDDRSDIGDGMTYFSHFASLGPYWWQDRAEDFDPATFDWAEART